MGKIKIRGQSGMVVSATEAHWIRSRIVRSPFNIKPTTIVYWAHLIADSNANSHKRGSKDGNGSLLRLPTIIAYSDNHVVLMLIRWNGDLKTWEGIIHCSLFLIASWWSSEGIRLHRPIAVRLYPPPVQHPRPRRHPILQHTYCEIWKGYGKVIFMIKRDKGMVKRNRTYKRSWWPLHLILGVNLEHLLKLFQSRLLT